MSKVIKCLECGGPLPPSKGKTGRKRTFYSDKCRKRTERRRKQSGHEKTIGNRDNGKSITGRLSVLEKRQEELLTGLESMGRTIDHILNILDLTILAGFPGPEDTGEREGPE
jgi:hypothetical protein